MAQVGRRVRTHRTVVLVACAIAISLAYLGALSLSPLIPPDEARYAEIPREMLARGDFITPTLNYLEYFEKPPLHYWLTASALATLGQNEWAARLWPAVLSLLTILAVFCAGRFLYGRSGLEAALVLAASPLWFAGAHLCHIDPIVASLLTGSLLSFLAFETAPGERSRLWLVAFYGCAALATLTKGLIGIVFPAAIVGLYLLFSRRLERLRDLGLAWGIPLYLAIAAPWFIAISLRDPGFLWFFFVHEHWLRYTSDIHGRDQGTGYLPLVLLASLLPFLPYVVSSAVRRAREAFRGRAEGPPVDLFLLIWAGFIVAFYAMSKSLLPLYLLPVIPPLALLIGRDVAERDALRPGVWDPTHRWALGGVGLLGVGVVGFALAGPQWLDDPGLTLWPYALPAVLGVIACGAPRLRSVGVAPFAAVGLGALAVSSGAFLMGQQIACRDRSAVELARVIDRRAGPDDRVMHYSYYYEDVSFYTGRRSVLVEFEGELAFGRRHAPERRDWFWDSRRLLDAWSGQRSLWLVVERDRLLKPAPGTHGEPLGVALGDYTEVARQRDTVLLSNRSRSAARVPRCGAPGRPRSWPARFGGDAERSPAQRGLAPGRRRLARETREELLGGRVDRKEGLDAQLVGRDVLGCVHGRDDGEEARRLAVEVELQRQHGHSACVAPVRLCDGPGQRDEALVQERVSRGQRLAAWTPNEGPRDQLPVDDAGR